MRTFTITQQQLPRRTLQDRLAEFLQTTRVGIDLGERAGGIAVVRRTTILHAETYVDFHAATLEQRRLLRRGRRTRHAKKMRMARLRSWVIRQKLPNGSHLPDPYVILQDSRFWRNAPSWIELSKNSQSDAEGFVRALTLIFKKRGYKFDDRCVGELSDTQLEEFLRNARIPPEAHDLQDEVERELTHREQRPDDARRGRKKMPTSTLRELFRQACARLPQPRVAEHRRVREAELRAVVDGFGRSARLSTPTVERWQKELAGLLNKAVRPARFDNRLRSTCAWCGQKTPRKWKVREQAYRAAVQNLRVREGWRERPLTEDEQREFLGWWSDREHAPGLETIKRRLQRLNPAQRGMASQFYDLLKHERPAGRTSLCQEHLAMAAQGKTMKDAGVAWQTPRLRKAPNPAREHHDARVLHRLEDVLFVRGCRGEAAWKHGPVSLISMEVPEPQTERSPRGQRPERKVEPFKERLRNELGGCCVYCGGPATDKDHIFPKSSDGPDIWNNLVAVCKQCNDEKGDRTPFQWMGSDADRWEAFTKRVASLPVSPRKKQLLLNEMDDFPGGDPTPLARVGSRPRQFAQAIQGLFQQYGLPLPEITVQLGKPHIQRVDGRLTAKLRESWRFQADGSENFPTKNPWDLRNHSQDAALLAACPPHTWRDLIFRAEGKRMLANGTVGIKPGLALPDLAPDWAGFATGRVPVHVLGRYPVTWKTSIFKETLWQHPSKAPGSTKLVKRMAVDKLTVKEFSNIVSPYYRSKFQTLAKQLGLSDKQPIPSDVLKKEFPALRHLKVRRQKPSGVIIQIRSGRGAVRYQAVDPKAASEGVVFWNVSKGGRSVLSISVIRPRALQKFGVPRYDPPLPQGAVRLGKPWWRHMLIELPADRKKKHPAGWYRVKEFDRGGVTVLPEHALPTELGRGVGLKFKKDADKEQLAVLRERKLGKTDLMAYFKGQKGIHGRGTATTECRSII